MLVEKTEILQHTSIEAFNMYFSYRFYKFNQYTHI